MQAFVDAYGDTSIVVEKARVTDFFVVTAVLVADDQVHAERLRADKIRKDFFGMGEMKSSSISANDSRRVAILED